MVLHRSIIALLVSVISISHAQERVYTTVDAQGRIQVITNSMPSEVGINKSQDKITTQETNKKTEDTLQYEGEEYLDSEQLEKQEQNKKEPNRFYYVPTDALGGKLVESEGGRAKSAETPLIQKNKLLIKFSPNYMALSTEWLLEKNLGINGYCRNLKKMPKPRPFNESNAIWIDAIDFSTREPDKILSFNDVVQEKMLVRISNFANSHKKPKFYLPLVVFLDHQGCTLGAAWSYWSELRPATDSQYSVVDGLLDVLPQTKYMAFYFVDKELKTTLPMQNYGALLLEKY